MKGLFRLVKEEGTIKEYILVYILCFAEPKQISMAIANGELMHECFTKHLRMGTARMIKTKKQMKKVRREV